MNKSQFPQSLIRIVRLLKFQIAAFKLQLRFHFSNDIFRFLFARIKQESCHFPEKWYFFHDYTVMVFCRLLWHLSFSRGERKRTARKSNSGCGFISLIVSLQNKITSGNFNDSVIPNNPSCKHLAKFAQNCSTLAMHTIVVNSKRSFGISSSIGKFELQKAAVSLEV